MPLFAITNFGAEFWDGFRPTQPIFDLFSDILVSGHEKLVKPDPAIYALLEADCGIVPEALIFVDDRPENIEAAMARGWKGHVFDGWQGWATRLVAEGLLTSQEAGL